MNDLPPHAKSLSDREALLQAVLDAQQSMTAYCEAVRDADGELIDFRYRIINQGVETLTGRRRHQILGELMTSLFPSVKQIGLFDLYRRVVETGQPDSFEFPYQGDGYNGWYLISAQPLQEGFVLSFIDITAQKQTQQQVEQQNHLLDNILTTSANGLVVLRPVRDSDGQIVDLKAVRWNRAFVQITGIPDQSLSTRTSMQLDPTLRSAGLFDQYVDLLTAGKPLQTQYYFEPAQIWIELSGARLDEEHIVLTFSDITESKKASLLIEEQSSQLRNIFDSSISSILYMTAIRNEAGKIVDFLMVTANQAVIRSNFMTPDQIEGKQLLKVFPGNRDNGFFDLYVRVTESGEPEHLIGSYKDDTQQDGWYEVSAAKQGDGVVVTYMNITETQQAQQVLEQQTEFLNQLLQTSPMGIIAYEAIRKTPAQAGGTGSATGEIVDFRAIFFNHAYEKIFNSTEEVVRNHTFLERFTSVVNLPLTVNTEELFNFYKSVTEQSLSFRRERFYPHLNKWLDVSGTKLGDGFLLVLYDVTDRKRAELERQQQAALVQQANRQLKRSNDSLQQFAYIASHDLQEPLRKVHSFGSLLKSRYAESLGDGVDLIARMQKAAERMQTLINDLLAYSRLSNQTESFEPVDLNEVMAGILEDLEAVITDKKALVTIDSLPVVQGNPSQLRQLFQNLLSNALKFNKPDERPAVTIRCQPAPRPQIDPDALTMLPADVEHFWQIQVKDNGIGFDQGYRERIFEAFQRLHGPNSAYAGSGIGLALVKRVAENHGGLIEAHSQPGEGAEFTLYLPQSPSGISSLV